MLGVNVDAVFKISRVLVARDERARTAWLVDQSRTIQYRWRKYPTNDAENHRRDSQICFFVATVSE